MGKKAADAGAQPKGGKGRLLPALVLAAGLAGGGYFMGGRGGAATPPADAAAHGAAAADGKQAHAPGKDAAKKKEEAGEVLRLDPLTLNLADGRYLKVGVALQLAKSVKAEKAKHEVPKALDKVIALLSGRPSAELVAPSGREHVKAQLTAGIGEAFHGKVLEVYFTEFVMQ